MKVFSTIYATVVNFLIYFHSFIKLIYIFDSFKTILLGFYFGISLFEFLVCRQVWDVSKNIFMLGTWLKSIFSFEKAELL